MNILVTGSKGFIGSNLISHLQELNDLNIVEFDLEDNLDIIDFASLDYVIHLAGVNRPKELSEFSVNSDLTKKLVDKLNNINSKATLILASSIQAELDNEYGKSKKRAEDYLLSNYNHAIIYRFHNVFGKWCKPNYNSVVATFCYNIAHDLNIHINNPKSEVELVYIDDVCNTFIEEIYGNILNHHKINYIEPRKTINLKDLSKLLYSFKDSMTSIYTPKTGDPFIKKLYSTFVSYLPLDKMEIKLDQNVDERGSFCELDKTFDSGQFSISYSLPGVIRGNHYHHTKMERFIVIKGKAKIILKHIVSGERYTYNVDDKNLKIITIPVGYTHSIENCGDDEMIFVLWCNELFDPDCPDTFYKRVY